MWRVILSASAVIFDGLMLIFMVFGFIGIAMESGRITMHSPASHVAAAPNVLPALIMISAFTVGTLLNIAAIAFGARLPRKAVVDPAATAGIFG